MHPKLRTCEVRGLIDSPPEQVVPGCLADVTIVTDSRQGVGVPAAAVQTRSQRQVVFVQRDHHAEMVVVKTGGDMDGWREILDGLPPGAPVVSMGQSLLDDEDAGDRGAGGVPMILSDLSVRRPVAMSSLIIGLVLLGLNAFRKMGLELMPKMDAPFVTIVTIYPGASPQELETDVAKRIEDAVVSIDGLKHVTSTCMENACQTLLEFEMGVDVDVAATDVREKLDLIRADLPSDVEDPQIQKFDINAKPIVNLALTGTTPWMNSTISPTTLCAIASR